MLLLCYFLNQIQTFLNFNLTKNIKQSIRFSEINFKFMRLGEKKSMLYFIYGSLYHNFFDPLTNNSLFLLF